MDKYALELGRVGGKDKKEDPSPRDSTDALLSKPEIPGLNLDKAMGKPLSAEEFAAEEEARKKKGFFKRWYEGEKWHTAILSYYKGTWLDVDMKKEYAILECEVNARDICKWEAESLSLVYALLMTGMNEMNFTMPGSKGQFHENWPDIYDEEWENENDGYTYMSQGVFYWNVVGASTLVSTLLYLSAILHTLLKLLVVFEIEENEWCDKWFKKLKWRKNLDQISGNLALGISFLSTGVWFYVNFCRRCTIDVPQIGDDAGYETCTVVKGVAVVITLMFLKFNVVDVGRIIQAFNCSVELGSKRVHAYQDHVLHSRAPDTPIVIEERNWIPVAQGLSSELVKLRKDPIERLIQLRELYDIGMLGEDEYYDLMELVQDTGDFAKCKHVLVSKIRETLDNDVKEFRNEMLASVESHHTRQHKGGKGGWAAGVMSTARI